MAGRNALGMQDAQRLLDEYLGRMDEGQRRGRAAMLQKLETMPASCRRGYILAIARESRMRAMNAHCLECAGWSRTEVALCEAVACALWAYRPYKKTWRRTLNCIRTA
jgi:hypothetical protein